MVCDRVEVSKARAKRPRTGVHLERLILLLYNLGSKLAFRAIIMHIHNPFLLNQRSFLIYDRSWIKIMH